MQMWMQKQKQAQACLSAAPPRASAAAPAALMHSAHTPSLVAGSTAPAASKFHMLGLAAQWASPQRVALCAVSNQNAMGYVLHDDVAAGAADELRVALL